MLSHGIESGVRECILVHVVVGTMATAHFATNTNRLVWKREFLFVLVNYRVEH